MPVTSCSSNSTKANFSGHVLITTIISCEMVNSAILEKDNLTDELRREETSCLACVSCTGHDRDSGDLVTW